jgi:TolB-like protein
MSRSKRESGGPFRRMLALAPLVIVWCLSASVAAAGKQPGASAAASAEAGRIAVLPLTNLSGGPEAAQLFDQLLFSGLAGRGPVVESGIVDAVMDSLRLRPTVALSIDQMRSLRQALGARYLVLGVVLEQTTIRTPEAQYPCAGVMVKVLDADSTRTVWAGTRFHCGDDRERIFGWGRDFDPAAVAKRISDELTQDIQRVVWPDSGRGQKR